MRNDFEGLINRINTAKERISETEFRIKEITQTKSKGPKKVVHGRTNTTEYPKAVGQYSSLTYV